MKIELLYFDGCPSHERLYPRLERLLRETGVSDPIELRRVESVDAAEAERFLGSPSLRIDGQDVEPGADERDDFGLKCRLYRSATGADALPPDAWIRTALESAKQAQAAPSLEHLAEAIGAARPSLDPLEQRVALTLYRLLADGRPVPVDALAVRVDQPPAGIERILERWPGVFRDDEQRVIGFHGLSLGETPHSFRVNGRQLYAWCAWDTLFLPQLLEAPAQVESRCPSSGEPVRLTVSPARVESVTPSQAVVSMLVPESAFDENVVASFCHYIHFFSSERAADAWIARHPSTFVLSVERAFELGQITNRAQFPTMLRGGGEPRAHTHRS
jgi:alkylmercury lyase